MGCTTSSLMDQDQEPTVFQLVEATQIPDDHGEELGVYSFSLSLFSREISPVENYHEPTIDYKRLTSFLEFDDSFLTPWNWNPSDLAGDSKSSMETKQDHIRFQTGSFFTCEGSTMMLEEETTEAFERKEKNQIEEDNSCSDDYDPFYDKYEEH